MIRFKILSLQPNIMSSAVKVWLRPVETLIQFSICGHMSCISVHSKNRCVNDSVSDLHRLHNGVFFILHLYRYSFMPKILCNDLYWNHSSLVSFVHLKGLLFTAFQSKFSHRLNCSSHFSSLFGLWYNLDTNMVYIVLQPLLSLQRAVIKSGLLGNRTQSFASRSLSIGHDWNIEVLIPWYMVKGTWILCVATSCWKVKNLPLLLKKSFIMWKPLS